MGTTAARQTPLRLRRRVVHRVVKEATSDDDGGAGREGMCAAMGFASSQPWQGGVQPEGRVVELRWFRRGSPERRRSRPAPG